MTNGLTHWSGADGQLHQGSRRKFAAPDQSGHLGETSGAKRGPGVCRSPLVCLLNRLDGPAIRDPLAASATSRSVSVRNRPDVRSHARRPSANHRLRPCSAVPSSEQGSRWAARLQPEYMEGAGGTAWVSGHWRRRFSRFRVRPEQSDGPRWPVGDPDTYSWNDLAVAVQQG